MPDTKQYTIDHNIPVGDLEMRVSLVITVEENGQFGINIENEVTGSESNFSLSRDELNQIIKWLNKMDIIL